MINKKVAGVTGFSGQAGRYLSKILLDRGYEVYGMIRRSSHPNLDFIKEMGLDDVKLVEMDLCDSYSVSKTIRDIRPELLFNMAAQSHVFTSFQQPELTMNVTGSGVLRILEAIRTESPETKLFQASTSEMFGSSPAPQNEKTPFVIESPYAASKLFAHDMCRLYRNSYGIYAACGILFNMESPHRGKLFLTKKVTDHIGRLVNGLVTEPLRVGNLEASRDWGYCLEYMEAAYSIMQQPKPDDFVIGTGETHTVREFITEAFVSAGISCSWIENTLVGEDNTKLVVTDPSFLRPSEVNMLKCDASKAKEVLGWTPKTSFKELVYMMVEADINKYR